VIGSTVAAQGGGNLLGNERITLRIGDEGHVDVDLPANYRQQPL
jgi:hypothetical protein